MISNRKQSPIILTLGSLSLHTDNRASADRDPGISSVPENPPERLDGQSKLCYFSSYNMSLLYLLHFYKVSKIFLSQQLIILCILVYYNNHLSPLKNPFKIYLSSLPQGKEFLTKKYQPDLQKKKKLKFLQLGKQKSSPLVLSW